MLSEPTLKVSGAYPKRQAALNDIVNPHEIHATQVLYKRFTTLHAKLYTNTLYTNLKPTWNN